MTLDAADFARQVEALRPQLLRFARGQLRNDAWAEDAVSDTLLAALEKPHSFAGRSQLKTWLVGGEFIYSRARSCARRAPRGPLAPERDDLPLPHL